MSGPLRGDFFGLTLYSVSQKNPPCGFLTFFHKRLKILHQYVTHLIYVHIYARIKILSVTT